MKIVKTKEIDKLFKDVKEIKICETIEEFTEEVKKRGQDAILIYEQKE